MTNIKNTSQDLLAELIRYLPIIEWLESKPELWGEVANPIGVATANGFRRAISEATSSSDLIKRLNASLAEARAERDRLREALIGMTMLVEGTGLVDFDEYDIARKALEGEGK